MANITVKYFLKEFHSKWGEHRIFGGGYNCRIELKKNE
jgi:hypothetical protein